LFPKKKTKKTLNATLDHFLTDCMALCGHHMLSMTLKCCLQQLLQHMQLRTQVVWLQCAFSWNQSKWSVVNNDPFFPLSLVSVKEGRTKFENIWNISIVALDHNCEKPHYS
jgi:hypothetical protein